jgi:hypothetical protein
MQGKCKHDTQCTYNVTLRRVRVTIVAVERQYYVLQVCVCSLSHAAREAHVACDHIFPRHPINVTTSGGGGGGGVI